MEGVVIWLHNDDLRVAFCYGRREGRERSAVRHNCKQWTKVYSVQQIPAYDAHEI